MIPDQNIREQALNPAQSFIVRAPAGSGKTELLTQRFLKLLAQVEHPQAVLAMTFTKKSAQEMRQRILNSLRKAQTEDEPQAPHARTTWQLARNVLARDTALNWQLLAYPHRLSIQTIDSLCMSLVRQMPMGSGLSASIQIDENVSHNYREAAIQTLYDGAQQQHLQKAVAHLLQHFDNQYESVIGVLVDLLRRRDQWAPLLLNKAWDELQAHLQQSLEMTICEALQNAHALMPRDKVDSLLALANFAAAQLEESSPLFHCLDLKTLPAAKSTQYHAWQGIASLLLTKEGQFRLALDKRQGFPPAKGAKDPAKNKQMKDDMLGLLEDIRSNHALRQALAYVQLLPPPVYSAQQWEFLQSLCSLLPLLLAQLQLIFSQKNKVDYSEIMLRALTALGDEEAPTDLALRLDYRIEHILVDEFQDTNIVQFSLLEKLTQGWQANDGRTLFFVGDPMQSIYRFREANVGLFLQVCEQGLGDLPIQPLTLSANFRSTPALVDWVNNTFVEILPPISDMNRGAIAFTHSVAIREDVEVSGTRMMIHSTRLAEAEALVKTIETLRAQDPQASIAILVRARQHLLDIIPLLQRSNLGYEAVDIEVLAYKSIIQDLLALTKALLHLDDTVAWFAVLRAPWCGLSLNDMHLLRHANLSLSLLENMQAEAVLNTLSVEGQARVRRLLVAILPCVPVQRYDLSWAVEKTWLALGGSACVNENALHDAYHFFRFLQTVAHENENINTFILDKEVAKLFSQTAKPQANAIQIMTIHKSKGLEFDYVLVPGLDRTNNTLMLPLLRWSVCQRQHAKHLLLGTRHEKIGDREPLYDFLGAQENEQDSFEMQRLLYVAVTRAKKGWYGFAVMEPEQEQPKANSFFALLWPVSTVQTLIEYGEPQNEDVQDDAPSRVQLSRLPVDWHLPESIETLTTAAVSREKINLVQDKLTPSWQRAVGIVVHRLLAQLAEKNHHVMQAPQYWATLLREQGVAQEDLPVALEFVTQAVTTIKADPRAQWILADHLEGKAEYPMQTYYQNEFHNVIIDRTFIDENDVRWIIDYKLTHAAHDIKNYEQQLNHYATLFRQFESRPIRLGLYFPLTGQWEEL